MAFLFKKFSPTADRGLLILISDDAKEEGHWSWSRVARWPWWLTRSTMPCWLERQGSRTLRWSRSTIFGPPCFSLRLECAALYPIQVSQHTVPEDLWLAFLGKVVNLTALVQANPGTLLPSVGTSAPKSGAELLMCVPGPLAQPLIDAAGSEISHWFDAKTSDVCTTTPPPSSS